MRCYVGSCVEALSPYALCVSLIRNGIGRLIAEVIGMSMFGGVIVDVFPQSLNGVWKLRNVLHRLFIDSFAEMGYGKVEVTGKACIRFPAGLDRQISKEAAHVANNAAVLLINAFVNGTLH